MNTTQLLSMYNKKTQRELEIHAVASKLTPEQYSEQISEWINSGKTLEEFEKEVKAKTQR